MDVTNVKYANRRRSKKGQHKELWGHKFNLVDKGLDESEICSYLGSMIKENTSLFRKLQYMDSLMELAEDAVVEAQKHTLEAEEEASRKASALITDAEERARTESDRITSEARLTAEKAAQAEIGKAARKAEEIKAQAEEEASRVLAVANEKADELVRQRMARAEEDAHEFVKQKKEQLKKNYQKLRASLDSSGICDVCANLSADDVMYNCEGCAQTLVPRQVAPIRVVIPLKVLPSFLRRRINKSWLSHPE